MAMELAQQMMAAQGFLNKQGQEQVIPEELIDDEVEENRKAKARGKGSSREASVKKKGASQKAQRQAALTGDLAPFRPASSPPM